MLSFKENSQTAAAFMWKPTLPNYKLCYLQRLVVSLCMVFIIQSIEIFPDDMACFSPVSTENCFCQGVPVAQESNHCSGKQNLHGPYDSINGICVLALYKGTLPRVKCTAHTTLKSETIPRGDWGTCPLQTDTMSPFFSRLTFCNSSNFVQKRLEEVGDF